MAGIGFELKKLYDKKGIFNKARAIGYSALIVLGPSLMSILLVQLFGMLLDIFKVSFLDQELFKATIMYSFVFSVSFTSGFALVLTRYISDKIYDKKLQDIKASLYGAITIITVISAIVSFAFYYNSPINFYYKLLASSIFISISVMQILSVYITAVKKYNILLFGFFIGITASVFLEFLSLKFINADKLILSEICFLICLIVIIFIMLFNIDRYFYKESKKYFEFLRYFKKFYTLFLIDTFYFLGLYIHNFIFWSVSDINRIVNDTFVYAPLYDIPTFYAFLSTILIYVIFVVKFETSFSIKWSEYLFNINNNASYRDIENAKYGMIDTLKSELEYIIMVQLIITIAGLSFMYILGGISNLTSSMQVILVILVLAYYCIAVIFLLITVLLYFDDRKGALFVSLMFLLSNTACTLFSVYLGEDYYGFGTFLASVFSVIIGFYRIDHFIRNIDYYIFCKNSAWN